MNKIPDYIDCNSEDIESCRYYITLACPGTCAMARDIVGMGAGTGEERGLVNRLGEESE